jgi:uncharacterized protein (DUF433 family)
MPLTEQIEQMLGSLTRAEKAELLQRMAKDLGDAYPGIDSSPDVCGGDARIVRVWVLDRARQLGTSEADLLKAYPSLRAEDLANAWAYVRSHRAEIDRQIRENEEA